MTASLSCSRPVTIRLNASLPTLEGCLIATCENGKSIRSIGSSQRSMAHGAKTDSDQAHPSGDYHPSARPASPGRLTRSSACRHAIDHIMAHYKHACILNSIRKFQLCLKPCNNDEYSNSVLPVIFPHFTHLNVTQPPAC